MLSTPADAAVRPLAALSDAAGLVRQDTAKEISPKTQNKPAVRGCMQDSFMVRQVLSASRA